MRLIKCKDTRKWDNCTGSGTGAPGGVRGRRSSPGRGVWHHEGKRGWYPFFIST